MNVKELAEKYYPQYWSISRLAHGADEEKRRRTHNEQHYSPQCGLRAHVQPQQLSS